MRTFILLTALMPIFTTGCFSSRDLSQQPPFSPYVGQTLELRRPMLVTKGGNWFLPNNARSVHTVDFCLEEVSSEAQKYQRVYMTLPIGHKVTIDRVTVDEEWPDLHCIVAYGHTVMPFTTKEQTFAYDWALSTTLYRAPWEQDTVPETRNAIDPELWKPSK